MNHAEWQHFCKEEAEWVLLQVLQLTEAGRMHWNMEAFFPAELIPGVNRCRAYIVQHFEASSVWNGNRLSFSAYETIHIPSGKGDVDVSFVYANGKHSYTFSLSRDEYYEDIATEALLEIYAENLVLKSNEAIWNAVAPEANMYAARIEDLFCFRNFPSWIRHNWLVNLSKRLMIEHKYTDFHKSVLDTNYRKRLLSI